jgi:hypothetical protein
MQFQGPGETELAEDLQRARRDYLASLVSTMWNYRSAEFGNQAIFDRNERSTARPPVFLKEHAVLNVVVPQHNEPRLTADIRRTLPARKRHRHFASMKSSQALAQSVFGFLMSANRLSLLEGLRADDGEIAFFSSAPPSERAALERSVDWLGEPRSTDVDFFCDGAERVAVECKFAEDGVGTCSRPDLKPGIDSDFDSDYCDGSYSIQRARKTRCSLTEKGIAYWRHIPNLFRWSNDQDYSHCPLRSTYQLTRNVLAACTSPIGADLRSENSHALLVYDSRNPAFQDNGDGMAAWQKVRSALRCQEQIRRCSWQRLIGHLQQETSIAGLIERLRAKYGLVAVEG